MPASSTSLGSLSSPSPTPSPPPPRRKGSAAHKTQAAYTNNKQAIPPHGLGSDSELSELTEEEQDTADKRENAPRAPDGDSTAAGDDESAGGTSVGGDVSTGTSTNPSRRARQKTSSGGGRKGVGRKKRSSLVPAPMWGWAETKSNVHEEEEEEEMSGPPKPMEEEEDEEEGEEGEEDRSIGGGHSAPIWVVRKAKGKRVVSRGEGDDEDDAMEVDPPPNPGKTNGSTASLKNAVASGTEDGEEEEEAESEEGESEDDKSVRIRRPKKPRSVSRADSKDQTESEGDEESDREKPKPKVAARPAPRRRGPLGNRPNTLGGRPRAARNFMLPSRSYQWNKRDKPEVPARGPPSPKSRDNGTEDEESEGGEKEEGDDDAPDPEVEEVDLPEALSTADGFSSTIVGSGCSKTASSPSQPSSRVVDPVSPLVGVIAAAAAASSIMAGSEVVDPPSPGTSTSSRSASPEPATSNGVANPTKKITANAEDDEDCGDTPTPTQPEKKEKPTKHVPPALNIGINGTAVDGGKDDEPSADADVDEPENEQEQEAENDNEVDIDAEIEEPSPEDDLEVELESDLQPAHRAEALDVLAAIELKFALLRERVYVEKMEGLAWEEKLVNEGTHPELIHIQKELLKRRDKRLELASRKREYELKSIAKKRRIHEDSTWSWWKLARDELQTDMIAEASRKRRKLERERRTAERPQPIRRLPMPPSEVPPAPSLRRIIKSFPFADKRKPRNSRSTPKQGAYPELAGLSTQEINADLEIFLSNRRGYDFRNNPVIGFPAPIAPPLGFGGYETYTDHLGNPIVPPGRIPQQHVPSFHQVPPPQGYAYPNPGTGRMPPPPPAHGHPPPHGHPPGPGMYPMDEAMGHMPQVVPHHYYPPQVNGGGYPPEGVPPHGVMMAGSVGHHGRRSPSPTIIGMNGKQPHGGWIGPGIAPGAMPVPPGYPGPGQGRPKGEWMAGDERRGVYPMGPEDEDRERERMMMMKERDQMEREKREMDREREKDRREGDREREMMPTEVERERERHMHMMGQHRQGPPLPGPPPPMHQHVHGMPPGQHHHIVGGHHHPRAPHHHHVVHHHHSQPPAPMGPNAPHPGSAMHSPRAPREYGDLRPGSGHGPYPTEVINVALNAKHRDEYPSSREQVEFRERERVRTSRRSSPAPGPSSQSQGSVMGPLPPPSHESGGLTPMPFVLAPTQGTSVNGTSSPRVPPGYDAHIRSPGHRFSGAGRSAPPTGPPTPSAGPPPSMSSGVSRESLTMSPARRPPPPQSPSLINERIDRERERDRDRDRDRERLGGGSGPIPNDTRGSPNLPRQRSPGPPVKYGPPPPPPPSASGISERGRTTPAMMMRPTSAGGATSPSIGYNKMRPISPPIGSKSLGSLQPLMSPMMGLAGPGRSATPAGSSEGRGRASSFASPSAARNNTNGIVVDGGEEREREREKDRSGGVVGEETKVMMAAVPSSPVRTTPSARATSPPVTLPPPSKMSLPQMVDGH